MLVFRGVSVVFLLLLEFHRWEPKCSGIRLWTCCESEHSHLEKKTNKLASVLNLGYVQGAFHLLDHYINQLYQFSIPILMLVSSLGFPLFLWIISQTNSNPSSLNGLVFEGNKNSLLHRISPSLRITFSPLKPRLRISRMRIKVMEALKRASLTKWSIHKFARVAIW